MQHRFISRTQDGLTISTARRLLTGAAAILMILGAAPDSAAQLKAVEAAATTVTISWTAPGDDGNTGTAFLYDLRYSTAMITAANWNDWNIISAAQNEPKPTAAGTVQTYTFADLNPSTTYYFAIRAGDEAGNWSGLSNVVSISTTAESIPPASVRDLRVTEATAAAISLAWTAPGDDSLTGTASQYSVRYATAPITEANWTSATAVITVPTPGAPGTTQTATVSGLQSGVTYYFAVKTRDDATNWSGLSNVVSGAPSGTDQTPPNQVIDLQVIQ